MMARRVERNHFSQYFRSVELHCLLHPQHFYYSRNAHLKGNWLDHLGQKDVVNKYWLMRSSTWLSNVHFHPRSQHSKEILPLCPALLRPHLERCIQLWGSQHQKDMDLLEGVQERARDMLWELEPLCSGDTVRDLGWFSLEKQLQGDFRDLSSI